MKSHFLLLLSAISCVAFALPLRLCHTNDFHARYVEINSFNSKCDEVSVASGDCFSGIARLATAMSQLNCDLKIQTGDMMQGTVYDVIFKEKIAIAGYRWVGYDMAVLGNHEFNGGPGPVYDTVLNTKNMIWLASNVNFTAAPAGFSMNQFIDLYGICWASVLTTATNDISLPGPDTFITDETIAIRKAIAKCQQQDRVIAVNHQGFDTDVQMCKDVKEIDLIIGGHSHTNLDDGEYPFKVEREDGSVCWVVQAFAYGRYVGALDLEFTDEGALKLLSHQYVPLDGRIENDRHVAAGLQKFTDELAEDIREVVAEAVDFIEGDRICRDRECSMGNLACDAVLREGARQGATLCFLNGGGVRASIDKGDVTVEDVLAVFPFGNVHAVITLPGSGVIAALEHGFTSVDNENNKGRYPQVAGMVVNADTSKAAGERVTSVMIDGAPIVEDQMYKIVTNSFMAGGGDGFTWPGATDFEFSGRQLSTLCQEYLEDNSPYTPTGIEGRVVDAAA